MAGEEIFEIPLSTGAQKFSIRLGDNTLQIRLVWREAQGGGWFIDLFDNDGVELIAGIPLRCGRDLLEEHAIRNHYLKETIEQTKALIYG